MKGNSLHTFALCKLLEEKKQIVNHYVYSHPLGSHKVESPPHPPPPHHHAPNFYWYIYHTFLFQGTYILHTSLNGLESSANYPVATHPG